MTFRRVWMVTGLAAAGVVWAAVLIGGLLVGVLLVPLPVAAAVAALLVIPGFVAAVSSNLLESDWRRRREVNVQRRLRGGLRRTATGSISS